MSYFRIVATVLSESSTSWFELLVVIALYLFALSAVAQTPETAAGAALPMELAVESVPNAINVPLRQLRAQLGELPRDQKILFIRGTRACCAARILLQKGSAQEPRWRHVGQNTGGELLAVDSTAFPETSRELAYEASEVTRVQP